MADAFMPSLFKTAARDSFYENGACILTSATSNGMRPAVRIGSDRLH
jgi:hypothetical protein